MFIFSEASLDLCWEFILLYLPFFDFFPMFYLTISDASLFVYFLYLSPFSSPPLVSPLCFLFSFLFLFSRPHHISIQLCLPTAWAYYWDNFICPILDFKGNGHAYLYLFISKKTHTHIQPRSIDVILFTDLTACIHKPMVPRGRMMAKNLFCCARYVLCIHP